MPYLDSRYFPLLAPAGTHTAYVFYNDRIAEIWELIGRRTAAVSNNGYAPRQSWIFFPGRATNAGGFSNVAIQGTNAASSVLSVDGKITAISATAATVTGLTNCTSATLAGNIGDPFSNVTAAGTNNSYLPTQWFLNIGHQAYDMTSEAKFLLAKLDSNAGQVTFSDTNQLGNLFAANVFSGTSALIGHPVNVIGYSYGLGRADRIQPWANSLSFAEGTIQAAAAVMNNAGVVVLPASPAPGILRTDGLRLDIAQCRGNQWRCRDADGVLRNATVAASSTAQVIYLTNGGTSLATWTANIGGKVWCGTAGGRADPDRTLGNPTEFYRGVTEDYIGLDLDDSIGSAAKPAATVGIMTHHEDGSCVIDPVDCFDLDLNTTSGLDDIDDSVLLCGRPVDQFVAPHFPWTFRGAQVYVRGLCGAGWVRDPGTNAVDAIPVLNFAEIGLDAKALLVAQGATDTMNVQTGTCASLGSTNSSDTQIVTSGITVPYFPCRADFSFHTDDGNYTAARGLFVSSNRANLNISVTAGTNSTDVDGRALVVDFGESAVEPQQVRSPWAGSVLWKPDVITVDGGAVVVDPPTAENPGTFHFLDKSQSFLSPRRQDINFNSTPQGFRDENSDSANAFYAGALAVFVGDNFFHPNIRDAGNVFFKAGGDPDEPYFKRHHVGLISQTNPADQGIRDGLRSGTVVSGGSFFIQTNKSFSADPVWGGTAASLTATVISATGTSVTFAAGGTDALSLWPQLQAGVNAQGRGLNLRVDTGTGTNAGTGNLLYQVDRVTSGIASSGANLTVSFTNSTAATLTGRPATLSLPYKPSMWHDYPITVTPADGGAAWQATATANTDGWFFFPATTNTISAGDRWRVGYDAAGFDRLKTGGVIRCGTSGAAGDWSFVAGGSDTARLMVPGTPQDFTADPNMNLEGFRKRYGMCVPTQMWTYAAENEVRARLLVMTAYEGSAGSPSAHGTTNRANIAAGVGASDVSSTNSISVLLASADTLAAGGSPSPFDDVADSFSSIDQPAQSIVSVRYGIPVPGSILDEASQAGFDTTAPYYDIPGGPFLRGLTGTTTVYAYAQIDDVDSPPVTSYDTGPTGDCGASNVRLFSAGSTGLVYHKFAPIGSFSGTTTAGSVGPVGGLTAGPWPTTSPHDVHNSILDSSFNVIACGTNVVETNWVSSSGGYYVPTVKSVVVPDFAGAAAAGW